MDRRRRGKRDRIVAMRSTFLLSKSGYSSQGCGFAFDPILCDELDVRKRFDGMMLR